MVPSITIQATVTSAKLLYLLSVPDDSLARNDSNHLWNSLAPGKLVPHEEIPPHKWWVKKNENFGKKKKKKGGEKKKKKNVVKPCEKHCWTAVWVLLPSRQRFPERRWETGRSVIDNSLQRKVSFRGLERRWSSSLWNNERLKFSVSIHTGAAATVCCTYSSCPVISPAGKPSISSIKIFYGPFLNL